MSVTCFGILAWFWMVPALMSRSTFAIVAVFLAGGTTVAITTWRNAQAAGSMAQILYEAEAAADPRRG